jgi:hypothetical protein
VFASRPAHTQLFYSVTPSFNLTALAVYTTLVFDMPLDSADSTRTPSRVSDMAKMSRGIDACRAGAGQELERFMGQRIIEGRKGTNLAERVARDATALLLTAISLSRGILLTGAIHLIFQEQSKFIYPLVRAETLWNGSESGSAFDGSRL